MIIGKRKSFPKRGKLLGIDWGEKRIGLAVTDPAQKFVFLRQTPPLRGSRQAAGAPVGSLVELAEDENIVGIVVGLPLRLDGTDSGTTRRVRAFAVELATATDIPIILFDESLTSFEASERTKDKRLLDSESARVLLENFLAAGNRK